MSADTLLSRLEGVKHTGNGRWIARCPAHDDKRPSLAIRELDDSRVLAHCFAQCSIEQILAAVGLDYDALFPERVLDHRVRRERRSFNAHDVLECLSTEALIVALAASDIVNGKPISDADKDRVMLAASRLSAAAEMAGAS